VAIVFVDVDGTLLHGPSSEALFVTYLLEIGAIGPRQVIEGIAFFFRWSRAFGWDTAKKNKAYLAGLDVGEVRAAAERFVRQQLVTRVRDSVRARIDEHRQRGEVIALLTGTPEFVAEPLARWLEADLWCGTDNARENGVFLSLPPVRHPFGAEKLRLALEICADKNVDLAACTAYADAIDDLALLRRVGRPIAVDPDPPLKRVAIRERWEILPGTR
jgi:HAD superfamily hydrolase (TIGR01490 family)